MIKTDELKIYKCTSEALPEYSTIPIEFEVKSIYEISKPTDNSIGFTFFEKPIHSWTKNYDQHESPENWVNRWNLSNWGFYLAYHNDMLVGGIAIAFNSPGIFMLEGRKDMCVLWDIRIHPKYRNLGIGKALFETAVDFAKTNKCKLIKIETQNINVPACKFYKKNGCQLGSLNLFAYPDLPNEIQLIWYKEISE